MRFLTREAKHASERRIRGGALIATDVAMLMLGAGLMYAFDATRGRRRRALARDKAFSAAREMAAGTGVVAHDLWNRTRGTVAQARSRWFGPTPSDEVLCARVRSVLGRVVSHPHAIAVSATQGYVVLTGPILSHEVDGLLAAVRRVPGVRGGENLMDEHKQPGGVPSLQGQGRVPGERLDVMRENWAPATRVIAGVAGAALAASGLRRADALGALLTIVGGGVALRAATNVDVGRLVGVGAGRRAVDVRKTINLRRPLEEVYDFWTNYDNFPLFMTNVKQVRSHENGTSHWVVAGPAGVRVEWDAVETRREPNRLIAWKTVPGSSTVASSGVVRFDRNPDGTTRVDVRIAYNPPAGAIGHAVASLFGCDPKSEMDADLLRMKTLLEAGRFPHDAALRPVSLPG